MATTTNYSWTTPDDTDLVKDGAAAIRTLGSSVDTTTKALNPSTTLGDIEYRSSTANTNTRLAIGTTGQVLTVSGGVPAWATPAGGGKVLQVVQAETTTVTNIASTSYTDTTLSATITPTSATSKILILANQSGFTYRDGVENLTKFQILRGVTSIKDFIYGAGQEVSGVSRAATHAITPLTFLDSPSTTSSTTYTVQAKVDTTANSGQYMAQRSNSVSTMTLLEIGA